MSEHEWSKNPALLFRSGFTNQVSASQRFEIRLRLLGSVLRLFAANSPPPSASPLSALPLLSIPSAVQKPPHSLKPTTLPTPSRFPTFNVECSWFNVECSPPTGIRPFFLIFAASQKPPSTTVNNRQPSLTPPSAACPS